MYDDPSTYEQPAEILGFIRDEVSAGRRAALVAVTGLAGGSMRQVGSLAAVSESGQMAGYVSNGCIDADIALQAVEILKSGAVTPLRYGAGSPFIDLQLPCGGSVDVVIDPDPDQDVVRSALDELDQRRAVRIGLDKRFGLVTVDAQNEVQDFDLLPGPRLVVAGRGASLKSVALQAIAAGFAVEYATPDTDDHAWLEGIGARKAFDMVSPWSPVAFEADRWTAVLLLFHDHIWEAQLLKAAVNTEACYIGCLGSTKTHANRVQVLQAEGLSPKEIDRIRGPVGLVPSMRSAPFLGLSVLSEIVDLLAEDKRLKGEVQPLEAVRSA